MSHPLGVRLLAVLLPVTAALSPVAAHAERLSTEDPAGDVARSVFDEGSDSAPAPAPEETEVDITRTVITHRAARLRVSVRFRDLRPAGSHLTYVKVRTPDGTFEIYVDRRRGKDRVGFSGPPDTQDCEGLRWSARNATDRVTVSLPTSCLDSPRWVQVGVGAARPETVEGDPVEEDGSYLADDAHRSGAVGNSVRVGAKVRRG